MFKLLTIVSLALATQGALGVAVYGQCGGIGYSGSTVCDSGSVCTFSNDYYSQCLPGTAAPTTTKAGTTAAPTTTAGSTTTVVAAPAGPTPAAGYTKMSNFGTNPNNVLAWVYKPKVLASPPALIVASHYCSGTAQAYYQGTKYAQLSEQKGYYVIYPEAPRSGTCWDVASTNTLVHDKGGDSLGIASAVRYAIKNWGIDSSKVFATGSSSGAMMTAVLMGAYPDLFKAGVIFSGVPYGCFAGSSAWNSQCSGGTLIKTPQQWGDQERSGYPGFTGDRPKVQMWHGSKDVTLSTQNFFEGVKQWTNVFGYSQTPISNVSMSGFPAGYSLSTYGPKFQAILAQGVGHELPVRETNALAFMGL